MVLIYWEAHDMRIAMMEMAIGIVLVKGKLPGSDIINRTSKRVELRPQKETTLENLAFHRFNKSRKRKLK